VLPEAGPRARREPCKHRSRGPPIKGSESLTYLEDKDLDPTPPIKGSESLTYLEDKNFDPMPRDPLAERPMSFDRKQETMLHPVVSQRSHDGAV